LKKAKTTARNKKAMKAKNEPIFLMSWIAGAEAAFIHIDYDGKPLVDLQIDDAKAMIKCLQKMVKDADKAFKSEKRLAKLKS
jgi:hypothetical protein